MPEENFYGGGYGASDRRVPDSSKLRAAGWDPKYDLRKALMECIQYYIRNYEPQTTPN